MKAKHWIRIVIFVMVALCIFAFAVKLMSVANEKDAVGVYGFMLEPEDSIDVVLVGSSEVYAHFYSPLAYEEKGFTSYALATSTMTGALYKYAAQIAIERQHPDVLVFDIWSFVYEDQLDETSLRKFIDALPDCDVKRNAINDLVPEDERSSYFFSFEKYHSSIDRLGTMFDVLEDKIRMKSKGYSVTKNFATTTRVCEPVTKEGQITISQEGFKYLEILLDYLKNADIEHVLFIRTPEMLSYQSTDSYTQMIDMIRAAGFDFVNLNAAVGDMGLDFSTDFYDTSHMNIFGVEKYTSFMAGYLTYMYGLESDHSPEVTAKWDNCASYNDQIITKLENDTAGNKNEFLYTQKDFLD